MFLSRFINGLYLQMARWLDGNAHSPRILQRQRRRVSVGTTGCETCAGENPCDNRGICQEENSRDGYVCLCPPGFSGKTCDKVGAHRFEVHKNSITTY